jgi:spectinomycin phosphotransferase
MLEPPEISTRRITAQLENSYPLRVQSLAFLPIGADVNTAVFRMASTARQVYFLKLRKGDFNAIAATVPKFLAGQGITAIIPPLETVAGQLWSELDAFKLFLYPYISGQDGYEVALTDQQWLDFGAALKAFHSVQVPPDLARQIPRETFSPAWRSEVARFQAEIEHQKYTDPIAAKLAEFMLYKRSEITHLVRRAHALAQTLKSQPLEFVLSHSDMHAGNLLVDDSGKVYIVDWDNPTFAPKERDLALVGGSSRWKDPRAAALFYQGYRDTAINQTAIAYFRYERIIMDIAAFCEQLLLSDQGGKDREQSLAFFTSNFLPGSEIDLAMQADSTP